MKVFSILLFCVLFVFGLKLAAQKPLWTDEINTQIGTIDPLSYRDIIFLEYFPESNKAPLFYLIQKGVSDIFKYQFPVEWDKRWNFYDLKSQIVLRLPSNLYMSLAFALIFYFFYKKFSFTYGMIALALTFSMPMVWEHWAEARPYGLWFLLSVIQLILFFKVFEKDKVDVKDWRNLTIVHIALSLTVIFSAIQVMIISFFLFLQKSRRIKPYLLMTFFPLVIDVFYYLEGKKMFRWMGEERPVPENISQSFPLFQDNFSKIWDCYPFELMVIFGIFLIFLIFKKKRSIGQNILTITFMNICFFTSAVFFLFYYVHTTDMRQPTPNRYFMYLTPVAIFLTTMFIQKCVVWFKQDKWMLTNIVILCFGLIVLRMIKTFLEFYRLGMF